MNRVFRLTVCLFIFNGLAGVAAAHGLHNQIDIPDPDIHSVPFDGRVVEISGKVIAINANSKSMELFDSQSRRLIEVRLTQLRKAERSALMRSDVCRVAVSGRAWMIDGRVVIDAQKIEAIPLEPDVKTQSSAESRQ